MTTAATIAVVGLYALALVAVSLTTPGRTLAKGEWKCFDEWCVTLVSSSRTGGSLTLQLSVQNRGRREQAPDTPRAWLTGDGGRDEVSIPGLAARVPGGSTVALAPVTLVAPASGHPAFLVTEGGFPSILVIGDENSPFHAPSRWELG